MIVSTGVAVGMIGVAGCSALPGGGGSSDSASSIVDSVRVVEHEMSYAGGGAGVVFAYVTGELVNVSENTIESLVLKVDFIGDDGEVIRSVTDSITSFSPDERFDFSVQFGSPSSQPELALSVDRYEITLHESAEDLEIEVVDQNGEAPNPETESDVSEPEPPENGS